MIHLIILIFAAKTRLPKTQQIQGKEETMMCNLENTTNKNISCRRRSVIKENQLGGEWEIVYTY